MLNKFTRENFDLSFFALTTIWLVVVIARLIGIIDNQFFDNYFLASLVGSFAFIKYVIQNGLNKWVRVIMILLTITIPSIGILLVNDIVTDRFDISIFQLDNFLNYILLPIFASSLVFILFHFVYGVAEEISKLSGRFSTLKRGFFTMLVITTTALIFSYTLIGLVNLPV